MELSATIRKYSRFILIFFNLIFVITGVILISVGASVKAYYHEYTNFLDDKYLYASDFLIIIGVIIFIISFFGCCGALKENACMTLTFSTLLIVVFILEAIGGIGGFVLRHKTDGYIESALTKTIDEYGESNFTEITKLWDEVQHNFQCCGIKNYSDWLNASSTTHGQIPVSCCKFKAGSKGNVTCDENEHGLYKVGCLEKFSEYIGGHATSIGSVGLALAVIQLLGIVLSCYLSKQIRSDYETV